MDLFQCSKDTGVENSPNMVCSMIIWEKRDILDPQIKKSMCKLVLAP